MHKTDLVSVVYAYRKSRIEHFVQYSENLTNCFTPIISAKNKVYMFIATHQMY